MRGLTRLGKRRHLRPCRLAPPFSIVFAVPGSGPGWRRAMRSASWPWRSRRRPPWQRSAGMTASCSALVRRFPMRASPLRWAISPIARAARSIRCSPARRSRPPRRRVGWPRISQRLRRWQKACRIVSRLGSRNRARRHWPETSARLSASNSSLSALKHRTESGNHFSEESDAETKTGSRRDPGSDGTSLTRLRLRPVRSGHSS